MCRLAIEGAIILLTWSRVCRLLLGAGADVNATEPSQNQNALQFAADKYSLFLLIAVTELLIYLVSYCSNHESVVRMLISAGANVAAVDSRVRLCSFPSVPF